MKRNRLRKKIPLLATLAVVAVTAFAYVFGLAWVQSKLYPQYRFESLIGPRLVDATIVGWLVYFCCSIGSFLNVVAWRMPRQQGIGGRSHCPRCANPLLTRDNIPVLGWISLGGRCRFCSLPISRRYPIVEALVGFTLTLVGIAEIYSLAIPGQLVHSHGGPLWAPRVSSVLLAILTYHAVALSTLWAMALIRIDGTRLPKKLLGFSVIAVIVPMIAYPTFMIVPWQTQRPEGWYPDGLYFDAVMRVVTALVAAALFGRVLGKGLCPTADLKLDPLGVGTARLVDLIAMLSVASLVIGWQSMPALVILASALSVLLRPLLRTIPINDGPKGHLDRRGRLEEFSFAVPFALTFHLVFWRLLWSSPFWPSDQSNRVVIIVSALLTLLIPLCFRETQPLGNVKTATPSDPGETEDAIRTIENQDSHQPGGDESGADELPDQQRDQEADDGDQRRDDSPSP